MYRVLGSSPRMRGAVRHVPLRVSEGGIIPAHAGSSCECHGSVNRQEDHPRACGEQASNGKSTYLNAGSSPRMRGAGWHGLGRENPPRIIPAHAGSSPPSPG